MKLLSILVIFIGLSAAARDTYVQGYYKSNGAYVEPHFRSAPNNTTLDNYSTRGNVNPYNGNQGTVNQYNNNRPAQNSAWGQQQQQNNMWGK